MLQLRLKQIFAIHSLGEQVESFAVGDKSRFKFKRIMGVNFSQRKHRRPFWNDERIILMHSPLCHTEIF